MVVSLDKKYNANGGRYLRRHSMDSRPSASQPLSDCALVFSRKERSNQVLHHHDDSVDCLHHTSDMGQVDNMALIKRKASRAALFLVPMLIHMWYGLIYLRDWRGSDESILYDVGGQMVRGIVKNDLTVFRIIDYPPLALLLIGLTRQALSCLGLDTPLKGRISSAFLQDRVVYYGVCTENLPIASRFLSSILFGLTCLLLFMLASKLKDERAGVYASTVWFLSFWLIPYSLWVAPELNGFKIDLQRHEFRLYPNHLLCIVFSLLSNYYLYDFDKGRNTVKSGIFFGLAALSMFNAYLTLPTLAIIWFTYKGKGLREDAQRILTYGVTGLSVYFIGNPGLWGDNLRHYYQLYCWLVKREYTGFFVTFMLDRLFTEDRVHALFFFLINSLIHPTALYVEFFLIQLFVFANFYTCIVGLGVDDNQRFTMIWFFSVLVFTSTLLRVTKLSWVLIRYTLYYLPPLSVWATLSLPKILAHVHGRAIITITDTRRRLTER